MPVIDMSGFKTQTEPMKAIEETLKDYKDGFLSGLEALGIINAISTEWRQ